MAKAALIIAVDRYSEKRFSELRAPAQDARELARVLGDATIGGFDVQVVTNPDSHAAIRNIEDFLVERKPDDLLLLYFSCHGVKDAGGRLHLAMADTVFGRFASTAISSTWIAERVHEGRSRRVVLMLDCCYSGAFEPGLAARASDQVDAGQQLGGNGRVVISASSATEYSFEGNQLSEEKAQTSIFTSAVVEGLGTGDADRDGDGLVSVDDLYGYVYDRVRASTSHQTPEMTGQLSGDLYLATSARIKTLPDALQAMVSSSESETRCGAVHWLSQLLTSSEPREVRAAQAQLERLADDDSRSVSDAAGAALSRTVPPTPPIVPPPKSPPPPPPNGPDRVETGPTPGKARVSVWLGVGLLLAGVAGIAAALVLVLGGGSSSNTTAITDRTHTLPTTGTPPQPPTPSSLSATAIATSVKREVRSAAPGTPFELERDGYNVSCDGSNPSSSWSSFEVKLIFVRRYCDPPKPVRNSYVGASHNYVVSISQPGVAAVARTRNELTRERGLDYGLPDAQGIMWSGCSGLKSYANGRIWLNWYTEASVCKHAPQVDPRWRTLDRKLSAQRATP